jgi:hypothetical protein
VCNFVVCQHKVVRWAKLNANTAFCAIIVDVYCVVCPFLHSGHKHRLPNSQRPPDKIKPALLHSAILDIRNHGLHFALGSSHAVLNCLVARHISDMLRAIADYSQNDRDEFIRAVTEAQANQQNGDIAKKNKRLALAQKRAAELEKLICKIYEDSVLGKLPEARYAALDEQYAKEQGELAKEIKEIETTLANFEKSRKSADKFIFLVEKYENFDTMTTTMLNEFVEKIHVHERDRKGSIETTQQVEIFFNFVGRYVPPQLEPKELTAEELEEQCKVEERKDRLHQNYLRRKARGKVAEDYEKTKAKKKAEMDAKKDAIRAEDIAKGVFVSVSTLPKKEPKRTNLAV